MKIDDLRQIADADIASQGDIALIRGFAHGQQVEQRSLACYIGADQPDAIMIVNLKVDALKNAFRPKGFACLNHTYNWHIYSPVTLFVCHDHAFRKTGFNAPLKLYQYLSILFAIQEALHQRTQTPNARCREQNIPFFVLITTLISIRFSISSRHLAG